MFFLRGISSLYVKKIAQEPGVESVRENVEIALESDELENILSSAPFINGSEKSAFVAGLVSSGEIFHPIGISSDEAYVFLKEIELYEEAGIICRIPNWWKSRRSAIKLSVSVGSREPSRLRLNTAYFTRRKTVAGKI